MIIYVFIKKWVHICSVCPSTRGDNSVRIFLPANLKVFTFERYRCCSSVYYTQCFVWKSNRRACMYGGEGGLYHGEKNMYRTIRYSGSPVVYLLGRNRGEASRAAMRRTAPLTKRGPRVRWPRLSPKTRVVNNVLMTRSSNKDPRAPSS